MRTAAPVIATLIVIGTAACAPASLDVDIVSDESFVLVHARDPSLSCACVDLDFVDVDVCLETTDGPSCACPSDETLPTAPCLDALRVTAGELELVGGGTQHSFSFFNSRVDPFADPVVAHLAGCGGSADIEVPAPVAAPRIVSAVRGDGGAVTLELDEALQRVVVLSDDGGSQHCGAPASSTVLVRAAPEEQAGFAVRLLRETGAATTPYGVGRTWFRHSDIRAVEAVTTLPDGALALPSSRASLELSVGDATFGVRGATTESATLRDGRLSFAVRVDEPDPAAPPAVAVDAFRVEVNLDGSAPRMELDIGGVTYLVNEPALDRVNGGVDVAEHLHIDRIIESALLVDVDGSAADIDADRLGLTILGPVLVSTFE